MKKLILAVTAVMIFAGTAFAGSAMAGDRIVEIVNPDQIFEKGYIQVIGESEAGQSRYRAKRAAEVVAQRRLLEIFQGLRLSGETTVRDGMLSSDKIKTRVEGTLRGAVPCGETFDRTEGYARVCLRLNLHGNDSVYSSFEDIILKSPQELKVREIPAFQPVNLPAVAPVPVVKQPAPKVETPAATVETPAAQIPAPAVETPAVKAPAAAETPAVETPAVEAPVVAMAPEAPAQPEVTAPTAENVAAVVAPAPVDGIIIDVRDFDFKPALVNRILSADGKALFDPSKVLNQVLIEKGCGGYTTDEQKAKALLESWGSKSPLVIKGKTVENVTDAVISNEDATLVFANDKQFNIFANARVVFVLK
ncbi:hypothetical protein [Maridesulfovibrio zosterae]|uniref:hypothetical protein n=1 Tax=Maridesulfovibrio zosterae TaxID=82171 RepID=UPI000419FA5D|nr:hypothetical protein [Maridesulfovibrio zosterae]